eukprot:TRINITY_DN14162_c0_g3_i1.p1 TRINITY_DN14162_c0_g3~~TRINITY_DN14162_c0_g3_i1.p1  ORF type:complete len:337 (+),score=44.51 TRINITY_DN14162_c0_g3_i1:110-1012(+)
MDVLESSPIRAVSVPPSFRKSGVKSKGAKLNPMSRASRGGGVVTIKAISSEYHRLRCQISGVVVRSPCIPRAEARNTLLKLRSCLFTRLEKLGSDVATSPEDRLRAIATTVSSGVAAIPTQRENAEVGNARRHNVKFRASFSAVLDARRFIGRCLSSPASLCVDEAISWRRHAAAAESEGWPSVRALWLRWLQMPRDRGLRRPATALTFEEAEARVAMADAVCETLHARAASKVHIRRARVERASSARVERNALAQRRLRRGIMIAVSRAERAFRAQTGGPRVRSLSVATLADVATARQA